MYSNLARTALHPHLGFANKVTRTAMKSMFSMVPGLPQEIINTIIDCCSSPRDLKALKKCALVCRAFLPRSQWHIFFDIKIPCAIQNGNIRTGGKRLDELYDILQHSPHIAGYVHEIHLIVQDNHSWAAGNPKFEWIMDHLTRNKVFNRFHFDGHLSKDKFGMIAPSHLQSFEQSFSQCYIVPFITSLRLYRVKNVPIGLIVSSSRLKKLSLIRTTLADIETRNPKLNNTTLPKLQELCFYRCSETVTALLGNYQHGSPPLLDLSQLHTLSFNQDSLKDIQCALRIIEVTTHSLKHINFIHRNNKPYIPFTGLLNLASIPHLRALRLNTVCGDKQALADLDGILSTAQPTHKISKVRINIYMSDHIGLSPRDALGVGCAMLDEAITKLHQGGAISFNLHFFFPRQPSRILLSRQKRALGKIGDMGKSEFSQMILAKLPFAMMHPGAVAITLQKDNTPKGAFRSMKGFLRRIRELAREW